MSRTFRRRNTTRNGGWCDLDYYTSEWFYPWEKYGYYTARIKVPFEKDSKEYKKGKAKFHSDSGTQRFKEPGPGWFRRMFHKKYKAHAKNELNKVRLDLNYEVDLHDSTEKYKMDYWT